MNSTSMKKDSTEVKKVGKVVVVVEVDAWSPI